MDMDIDMSDDGVVPVSTTLPAPTPAPVQSSGPIHTVYVRNLNYKLEPNELRIGLYNEFIKFGEILDIVVGLKRYALKGQAWIIFDKVEDAANAVAQMNGKVVLNRPVTVSFAKTESDLILKREGRFVYAKRTFESYAEKLKQMEDSGRAAVSRLYNNPPNHRLLFFDLPSNISNEVLLPLLKPYSGFKELSIVPGGRGIAFVDFDSVRNAGVCLSAIKNISLPTGEKISATYAK